MPALDYRRAAENAATLTAVSAMLAECWDPAGEIRAAAGGGEGFYAEHGLTVAAMLAADAQPPEVQRYLRQVEQGARGVSLHPVEVRRAIAEALWRLVRGLGALRDP